MLEVGTNRGRLPNRNDELEEGSGKVTVLNDASRKDDPGGFAADQSDSLKIEDFHGEVLSQINDAVIVIDNDERVVYLNPAAERMYGVTGSESIGHSLCETHRYVWLRPEDEKNAYAALRENGSWRGRNIHIKKNGEEIYVESAVSLLRDHGNSNVTGMLAIIRDITDQQRAESEMRKFVSLAENSDEFIAMCDPDRIAFYVNRAGLKTVGLDDAPHFQPTPVREFFFPEDQDFIANEFLPRVLREGHANTEIRFRHFKTGEAIWMLHNAFCIIGEDGSPSALATISYNISERKKAEVELRRTNAVLNAINLNTPTCIYVKDRESRMLAANPAALEVFDQPLSAIIGKNPAEYLGSTEEVEMVRANDSLIIESGKTQTFEEAFQTPKGFRIFLSTKTPYQNENEEIIGLIGVSVDITERKRIEKRLLESERKWQRLADAMPQLVWIADANGGVYHFNRRVEEIAGIEKNDDGTWSWQSALHPDDRQATVDTWESAVRERKIYVIEHRLRVKSSGYRWHLTRALPVSDETGNLSKWYGTATDIHELKEAEAEAECLLETAKAANRAKDEFLAILSHELRTPLNTMSGWSQLLLKNTLDQEKTRKAVEIINRSVQLQNALIEDLLDVSRIISGKMQLEPENLSFVSIVDAVVDAARPAAEKQHIRLESEFDADADEMLGDRPRLMQIVGNLLTNALKFTPEGGVVTVKLKRVEGETAKLTVSDTGIGIARNLLPHIFDRFRQADVSLKRKYGGLGLGLTIVKHLVELHGGAISADSDGEGKGTIFTVELPLKRKLAGAEPGGTTAPRGEKNSDDNRLLAGIRILIVDDDQDSLDLLCYALKEEGADVTSCDSGSQALEKLRNNEFDLLISDLGMAEIDGYDLVRHLREQESLVGRKPLPAAALTGYVSAEDRSRVLQVGYQMHLAKPVNIENLPAEVLKLVEG